MAKTLAAVSLWSALACDSGSRVAGGVPLTSCTEKLGFEGLLAAGQLSLSIPATWAGVSDLLPGRIIRLEYTDGDWDEYRIEEIVTGSPVATVSITAKSIAYDLALADTYPTDHAATGTGLPQDTDYSVTKRDSVTALVAWALTGAPAYVTAGTLTPAAIVAQVTADSAAPLAILLDVAAGAKAATGVTYYVSLRRVGSTGYALDITDLNATAAVPDLRTGKNLLSMKRTYGREVATRVYPQLANNFYLGAGTHVFVVTAVSANTYIDIEDPNGRGIPPIAADDAVNGLYWYGDWGSGTAGPPAAYGRLQAITDSAVVGTAARLSMADTSGFAVGSYGRIVASSNTTVTNATWVGHQDHPGQEAALAGRRILKLNVPEGGADNYLRNGDLSAWSGGAPLHYTPEPGYDQPTQDTTYYLSGGSSAKFIQPTPILRQTYDIITWGTSARPAYWRYRVRYYHVTADINARFVYTDISQANSAQVTVNIRNANSTTGVWHTYTSPELTITTAGKRVLDVQLFGTFGAGAAEWYVDSIEALCYGPGAFPENPTFTFQTTGAWLRGVTYLRNPPVTYEASFLDLSRYDDGTWPYDALVLGGPVQITDTDLSLTVTARVTAIDRDHLKPLSSKVTLSSRRDTLTNLLVTGG